MSITASDTEKVRIGPSHLHKESEMNWTKFLNRPIFSPQRLSCETYLEGRTILITGAGGSLGSAVALRLLHCPSHRLILFDHSAEKLQALRFKCGEVRGIIPHVEFIEANILDANALQEVFAGYEPHVIFHTAALKHLSPLESDPFVALENNILGTVRLLEFVDCFPVEYFVNISSDKAVNPTSVLGVSKRISELLLVAAESLGAHRLSMRLGSVLESSGSVVSIFVEAIKNHRPLTITDSEASRYFVTLDEAAALLVESLRMRESSILLPEMGCPHKITDLAAFVMNEYQTCPSVSHVSFVGLCDGEKRCEQLTYDGERLLTTAVRQIYQVASNTVRDSEKFADKLGEALELVQKRRKAGLIDALLDLVPEFEPSRTLLRFVG